MKDLKIIEQLMNGNHLNSNEVQRAKEILHGLSIRLESLLPEKIEFTRINNDTNGNPRYVCSYSDLLNEEERKLKYDESYKIALKKAKQIGGKKFHNKQYGGGIVFQSYNTDSLQKKIIQNR